MINTPFTQAAFKAMLSILLCFGISRSYAGIEKYSCAVSTKLGAVNAFSLGAYAIAQDAQYVKYMNALIAVPATVWYGAGNGLTAGTFQDKSRKNRVILSIDHTDSYFTSTAYTVVVDFQVTYKSHNGSSFQPTTSNQQLTITNNQAAVNKDKAVYEFNGGNELQVKITGITITGGGITLTNAKLLMIAEIEIDRYYFFDRDAQYPTADLTHCSADLLTKGELEVKWKPIVGAEMYELEWVYINNYDGTKTGPNYNQLAANALLLDEKVFELNSTRISTNNNYYRIPYIYERGYILYRLRGWGRKGSAMTYDMPGKWSTEMGSVGSPTNVSQFLNFFPLTSGGCPGANEAFISFNDAMNWQSNISYAEEGKSKAVVNFADGSLRSRQSVTKLKSSNEVIIGETVYDFQGRPAINILPVPSPTLQRIAYTPSFNVVSGTNSYLKQDFDYDQGSCAATAPTLNVGSGASYYYSPSNTLTVNENKFIPDAKGYPYTQIEYTPDNTGRIRNQSGVGPDHQLGSGHEAKYLYGVPEQKDIDRLFAGEVGYASRYKKNIVVDANGQASVTYLDPVGKTIATALAGATPTNVMSLASSGSVLTTYDLLNKINPANNSGLANTLDIPAKKLTLQKSILVPSNGPYTFTYSVTPPKYTENCGGTFLLPPNKTVNTSGTKCYNCVLDGKVSLLNECGVELFSQSISATPPGNFTVMGTQDASCPGVANPVFTKTFTPYDVTNVSSTAWLKTGSYLLEKSLSVNQPALDAYTNNYMDTLLNPCILKLSDFKAAQNLAIDLSGCGMNCNTCNAALGSYSLYTGPNCKVCLTQAQYDSLKAECDELCNNVSEKCENALAMMEADVNPTGQYGQYNSASVNNATVIIVPQPNNTASVTSFPLSVFNESASNALPIKTNINTLFSSSGYTAASFSATTSSYVYHPDWHHPYNPNTSITPSDPKKFNYLDDNGNISYVKVIGSSPNYTPAVHSLHFNKVIQDPNTGDYKVPVKYLANLQDFLNIWESQWASSLVIYHPEYCFYEKCVVDQLSNNYDENLLEIDIVSDFNTYLNSTGTATTSGQFMFPVGIPPVSGTTPYSGSIIDPYFKAAGSGSVELANIRTAMVNYMQDPSNPNSYITIWDAAYRIVHCPNAAPGSICATTSISPGYVFTTDEEWQTFKGMYLSLKQSFQDKVNIRYSIGKTGYNGCIGVDVFDPFAYNFYDPSAYTLIFNPNFTAFWAAFGWNFFWPVIATNTSQYYNPEQNCQLKTHYLYSGKNARFATAKMLMPDALANISPPCYDDNNNIIPCPESAGTALTRFGNMMDVAAYANCRQCPTAVNFEMLLKGLVTFSTAPGQLDITNSSTPGVTLTCATTNSKHKEFTNEIFKNLFSINVPTANVYWKMDNAASGGTYLKGKISHNATDCDVYIQMPPYVVSAATSGYTFTAPFTNTYTFNDVIDFCCIVFNPTAYNFPVVGVVSGPGRFSGQVTVKVKPGDPLYNASQETYRKINIEGYAPCMNFQSCALEPVCEASKEIKHLQNMVNSLLFTNATMTAAAIYSASPVVLTNVPYSGFLQPVLLASLDNAVDPFNNNLADNWFWNFSSSAGKQLSGYFKPNNNVGTGQCSLTLQINPLSVFGGGDIEKITGILPSTVTTAPAGAFTAYALLKNASASPSLAWEPITGTVSCLSAGKCATTSISSNFEIGQVNHDVGLTYCPNSECNGPFLLLNPRYNNKTIAQIVAASDGTLVNSNTVFTGRTDNCVTTSVACTFSIFLPQNVNYDFLNAVVTITLGQPNLTIPNGLGNYNHFYVYATVTPSVGPAFTAVYDGYVPCIDFPVCRICSNVGNLVRNGDFEEGNKSFYTDYTFDPQSSLSYSNYPTLAMPYAASPHGKFYNVYNIKPVWGCTPGDMTGDHTTVLATNSIVLQPSLTCAANGNGKALVVRSENITLDYATALPGDIWSQYVNLVPNTVYAWRAFFKNIYPPPALNGSPNGYGLVFQVYLNNTLINQTIATGATVPFFPPLDLVWHTSQFSFNSGSNTVNTKMSIKCFYAVCPNYTTFTNPTPTPNTDYLFMVDDISLVGCIDGDPNSIACDVPAQFIEPQEDDCVQNILNTAMEEAEYNYSFYLDTLRKSFQNRYVKKCLDTYEDFFMKCYDSENQFMLYYYDKAGNLVKTVPPQGVNRIPDNPGILSQIMQDRENNTQTVFTTHSYASVYKYNSINQLVEQEIPDHEGIGSWKAANFTGVANTQSIQGVAFNGSNGVLVSNLGGSGYLYTFNQTTNAWVPVTNLTLNNLNDVVYVTTNTYYAVGKDGTVLKTTNGGTSWNLMPFPNNSAELLKAWVLPSSTEIVAFDKDGNSWTSSASGTVWTQASNVFGFVAGEKLVDVKINAIGTNGWAISSTNRIFGRTGAFWQWTPISSNIRSVGLHKVAGDGSATVYSVGDDGTLLKSTNSGLSWTEKVSQFNTPITDADFYSANSGFIVTQGSVYQTVSSGNAFFSLSALSNPPGNAQFITLCNGLVYCLDASTGNLMSYNYLTPTPSWTTLATLPLGTYNSLSTISSNLLMAGGNSELLSVYDISLDTWFQLPNTSLLSGADVMSASFKDNAGDIEGYLVTNNGEVYRYDNSANPNPLTLVSLTSTLYRDVYAMTYNTAMAVSGDGVFANISGTSGSETVPVAANNLRSVFVTPGGDLVAVGENTSSQTGQIHMGTVSSNLFADASPYVTIPQLKAVCYSGSDFYMSGTDGTVLKYNNATGTWDTRATGSNTQFDAIACSGNNVIAVGKKDNTGTANNQVSYSSNGGVTWTNIVNTIDDLTGVKLANGYAYVVGKNNKIATALWPPASLTLIATPSGVNQFNAITSNGSTGLKAVGQNGLLFGINASLNTAASENNFNPPVLNDVKWFDATHVIAVGNNSQLLVSDNAGVSWSAVSAGTLVSNFKGVDILNATTAIVVGDNNGYRQVAYSCVGPNCSYTVSTPASVPPSGAYNDVSISNGNILVVTNTGSMYYKPAAAGFSALTPSAANPLRGVFMLDNSFAYAVGDNGTLMKITPSALTATLISPGFIGNANNLYSVYFKDNFIGYAVGTNGILAKTTDGGQTWSSQGTPSSLTSLNTINVVVPVNNNNIVVAGSGGGSGSVQDNQNNVSSRFYYDKLGRLVASQNSRQYAKDQFTYSYNKYDALGRILEIGEVRATSDIELLPNTSNAQVDMAALTTWLGNGANVFSEITKTYYDAPAGALPAAYDGSGAFVQDLFSMRNRASYFTYQDIAGATVDAATFYSYDAHGNVKTLYQYNAALPAGNKYKRTDYDYDLISGKVNSVSYQATKVDQFYHKYYYDDDNRITNVYTSKDNTIWDQDAKYFYYRHGPLARTEVGDAKVQANDFAYTIHGWTKGTNSNKLNWNNDIGQDAKPLSANGINGFVSEDVTGYSLSYYKNDYQSIVPGSASPSTYFLADATGSSIDANNRNMFNGNISNMTKSIKSFMVSNGGKPQNYMYRYDQLNRLVQATSFEDYNASTNVWNNVALNNRYKEFMVYDANGNIQRLKRYDGAGNVMDSLTYMYNNIGNNLLKNTNKLAAALDAVSTGTITDDIESNQSYNANNHTLDNYQYDNIGNLVKDGQSGIGSIEWTLSGKIKNIIRANTSSDPDIFYSYDASGNRIGKTVKTKASPGVYTAPNQWTYTYYQRDCRGEIIAVYEQNIANSSTLSLIEQHIYSENRLGILSRNQNVISAWASTGFTYRNAGEKSFGLSNHLGNVLTTVSDRKLPVDNGVFNASGVQTSSVQDGFTDYFTPDILSATDYYAFGSPMPGRRININSYRFGFNDQEKENELWNGATFYKFRVADNRLGRFFSVDPLAHKFPHNSSYAFAENSTIAYFELEGMEKVHFQNRDKTIDVTGMSNAQIEKLVVANGYHWDSDWYDPNAKSHEYWNFSQSFDSFHHSQGTNLEKYNWKAIYDMRGKVYYSDWDRTFLEWMRAKDAELNNDWKEGVKFGLQSASMVLGGIGIFVKGGAALATWGGAWTLTGMAFTADDITAIGGESMLSNTIKDKLGKNWQQAYEITKLTFGALDAAKGTIDVGVTLSDGSQLDLLWDVSNKVMTTTGYVAAPVIDQSSKK